MAHEDLLPERRKKPIETREPEYKDEDSFEGTPLPEDEVKGSDESDLENAATLGALGQMLSEKFRDVSVKRQYVEDRWLEDLRQYHGRYDSEIETALKEVESCALFLNITRPKTNAYSARVIDMVLPTDDKNWGLSHTPVPEMVGINELNSDQPVMQTAPDGTMTPMVSESGEPVLEKDVSKGVEEEAKARAEKMEKEIDDQLAEAKFNAVQRQAIDQMSKLGTSVLLGPVILDEWRVTWKPQPNPETGKTDYVRTLVPNTSKRAGAQWVDIWNFYPDMSCPRPEGLEFAFIQHLVNKSEFRKIAKRFNFLEGKSEEAMAGGYMNISTIRWMNELRMMSETMNYVDNRYQLLRYFGEITREDLIAVGKDPDAMGLSDTDTIMGQVWLCNSVILKIELNPLDSGALPFSICYCDKDEASIFGIGMPRMMRGEQESVNSSWRMLHDNGGLSVGPQTIMKANAVYPADGDYHLKPKKLWYMTDESVDVRTVFGQYKIDSAQPELQNLLQLGIRFADDVTQMPLLMQGDQAPHITQTAQGMSLLYNASTVVLRRTVKLYDDTITEPMITRFYEWNMQFNERDDIKGDMRTIARGSSTLLEKEQLGQSLDVAMQLAMQPTWQPYTDMKKLYKQALKAKRIPDIILDDDKIEANLAAQAEAAAAAAQAGAPQAEAPDPMAAEKIAVEREKIAQKDREMATRERIAISEMATKQQISLEAATTRFAGIKLSEDYKNQRTNQEINVKQQMGTGI